MKLKQDVSSEEQRDDILMKPWTALPFSYRSKALMIVKAKYILGIYFGMLMILFGYATDDAVDQGGYSDCTKNIQKDVYRNHQRLRYL